MRPIMKLILNYSDGLRERLGVDAKATPNAIRRPVGIVDEFVEPLLNAVDNVRVGISLGINQVIADMAGLRERAEDCEHGVAATSGQSGLVNECPRRSWLSVRWARGARPKQNRKVAGPAGNARINLLVRCDQVSHPCPAATRHTGAIGPRLARGLRLCTS